MSVALQNIQRELDKCYEQATTAHKCKLTDTICMQKYQQRTMAAQLKCSDIAEAAAASARNTAPSTSESFSANQPNASKHGVPAHVDP